MDVKNALPLKRKLLNHYFFLNLQKTVIIFITLSIIAGAIYYCLSCGASQMMQAFKSTSDWSDESDEHYGRRQPLYSIEWEIEDEIVADDKFYTRKAYLEQKCRDLNVQRESNFRELIINHENDLIYCNIFGAASSTWLYYFNLLIGYNEDYLNKDRTIDEALSFVSERNPKLSSTEFEGISNYYLSFILVRHPYDRLVNIYVEQFILNSRSEWFKEIGEQIILTTRIENEVEKDRFGRIRKFEYPPTFEEFVRFILCQWRNNRTADEHWIPAATFCTPCQVNFKLILKFETLEDDEIYLEKRAGLQNMKKSIEPIIAKLVLAEEVGDSTKKYFSQLSKQQILELYEYYKEDFELFGYTAEKKYLELGREVHTSPSCFKLPDDSTYLPI